jgi:DNA-directed RNA polymerase specialized sigma24 family protein
MTSVKQIDLIIEFLNGLKEELVKKESQYLTLQQTKANACEKFHTTEHEVFTRKSRKPECVAAREEAVTLLRGYGYTYGEICNACNIHKDTVRDILKRSKQREATDSN